MFIFGLIVGIVIGIIVGVVGLGIYFKAPPFFN